MHYFIYAFILASPKNDKAWERSIGNTYHIYDICVYIYIYEMYIYMLYVCMYVYAISLEESSSTGCSMLKLIRHLCFSSLLKKLTSTSQGNIHNF